MGSDFGLWQRRLHEGKAAQALQARRSAAARGYNRGTQGSFANNGPGSQNFRDVNYKTDRAIGLYYSCNRHYSSNPYYHNGNIVVRNIYPYNDNIVTIPDNFHMEISTDVRFPLKW